MTSILKKPGTIGLLTLLGAFSVTDSSMALGRKKIRVACEYQRLLDGEPVGRTIEGCANGRFERLVVRRANRRARKACDQFVSSIVNDLDDCRFVRCERY